VAAPSRSYQSQACFSCSPEGSLCSEAPPLSSGGVTTNGGVRSNPFECKLPLLLRCSAVGQTPLGRLSAFNNGRRGHRESLLLGVPANHAAKRAGGGKATGIANEARTAIGLKKTDNEDITAVRAPKSPRARKKAMLGVTADEIVKEWKDDLEKNPIQHPQC